MRCAACREAFSPFHDGALEGAEAADVSAHIDGCAACRGEWEAYCRAMRLLAWGGGPTEPPGLAARVEQAWRATTPDRAEAPAGGARMRGLGVAVFLVAAAGAVVASRPWTPGQATSPRIADPSPRVPGPAPAEAPLEPTPAVPSEPGHTKKQTQEVLPDGRTRTVIEEDWVEGGVRHHSRSETVR